MLDAKNSTLISLSLSRLWNLLRILSSFLLSVL